MTTALEDRLRRTELGEFLRNRRARITPEQVGLPVGGRRRTPGLRREEVAQLAGVGVTWYTWLEQGRDINASEQVLSAISRTLRLDPHEHVHLFTLAGAPEPMTEQKACAVITPSLQDTLVQLEPFPAAVRNARYDVLGYNAGYDWLMGGVDRIPFEDRNTLVQVLLNPEWKKRMLDWDQNVSRLVSAFRAAMAEHMAEPAWKSLVKRLQAESPCFEELWRRHDVNSELSPTKRYLHPEVGLLTFNFTYLYLGRRSETRLSVYTPANPETAEKLQAAVPRNA
ncbi:helix-turn-helix transcriptional regulator [Amycolatopsis benzoatilytica]|uniref:helix-turn-helix transcriptional regulator n=1 Tax=Amycolatopsis benzoatilytica TaxID=346045 RepID=UPI0003789396|nr:helix-turn-helix transcriptional regulator [Amycolatopsis benzoatilytica]